MSIDHEPRIQELYSKLTVDYLKECAENDKIDEWNAQYLEYLHLASGFYKNRNYPSLEEQKEDSSFKFSDDMIDLESKNMAWIKRPNFNYADFSGLNLKNVMLRMADLEFVKFLDSPLQNARFAGANLKHALFIKSQLRGVDFTRTELEYATFSNICLDEVNFSWANLNGVIFIKFQGKNLRFLGTDLSLAQGHIVSIRNTYFNGANLNKANFENAIIINSQFKLAKLVETNFHKADLTECTFPYTILIDTVFIKANLTKTNFYFAEVNGGTIFEGIIIDDDTDFTGVGLSNVRISPIDKVRLEKNIRKKHWEEWYTTHIVLSYPARLFWWLSDYGSSCKRCLLSFVGLIVLAFIVNFVLTQSTSPDIAELFANTVLALFGVGDPGLEGTARLWQVVYVISGYFLLAVLISRFAIMFQNMSP